jgi:aspartate racemase
MSKTTLGVIGGLGPMATAHFMELVINMTDAKTDQEHLDMIIYNSPSIPDRTNYILDNSKPNPLSEIVKLGKKLQEQNTEIIAIPCITACYFHESLRSDISVPVIHTVRETVMYLKENGVKKVGIMATDGTIKAGLFQRELESAGLRAVVPTADRQKDVMSLIYDSVKAGNPVDMERFEKVKLELFESGAETIILGCTELSMIKRDYKIGSGFIDAMEVLAAVSVEKCGAKLKDNYRQLIT